MMSQPLGTRGLWTVNEPRDGPSVRSQDAFPLPQQRPSHPEMSEHHHRTDTPKIIGDACDLDTLIWVKSPDANLHAQLATVGPVNSGESAATLVAFVDRDVADRSDANPSTATADRRTRAPSRRLRQHQPRQVM